MPNYIQARVHVNLPHDSAGQTAGPGQVITVDSDDPTIVGYLTTGYLTPLEPLTFASAKIPPIAPIPDDAAADFDAEAAAAAELIPTALRGAAPVEAATPQSATPVEDAERTTARAELESMTKAQLLGQFEAQTQAAGVDDSNTKAEIIAAILT